MPAPEQHLDSRIDFRVTREEWQEIQEEAEASGLSVSEYVRRRALGRCVDSVTDVKMISELRRQGGLLKKIYSESGGMYSEKTATVFANINRFTFARSCCFNWTVWFDAYFAFCL